MDIKILENLLQVTIDRGNLRNRHHQVIQKEDYGQSWSSQEWKSGAAEHDRSGKSEIIYWDILQKVDPHREERLLGGNAHSARYEETIHDGLGKLETVNHQEQAYSENFVLGSDTAESLNAATFMGKNFSTIQSFVMNSEDLTLKQMFDVNNQDEINGLDKILWGKNSWKRLSLIGDETVINLQRTKVYVFSDSVLCLGKVLQHP